MAKFTAIFDGSGSPNDTVALVVAGFVAREEQWIEFERNWKECLNDFNITALHMREFAHSRGEFGSWKGDETKRRAFLSRLISIIRTRVQHTFASAVLLSDYRELDKEYRLSEFAKPYAMAGGTCLSRLAHWARKWMKAGDLIQIVFEDGDQDKGDLMRLAKQHFGINPSFLPKSRSLIFQAADLVAYEHLLANRKIADLGGKRIVDFDEFRYPLKRLSGVPGAFTADWGVRNREDILNTLKMANVAKRA
jgi:hypothetical protein